MTSTFHFSKFQRKRRHEEKETHAANNGALHPFRHERRHGGRTCYTIGISFLSLKNPHFVNFCNTLNPRYNPPSRRVVSSSKLDEADRKITEWKKTYFGARSYLFDKWRLHKQGTSKSGEFWSFHLSWSSALACVPCLAHISSLLLKDIAKIYWIDRVLTQTKDIALFFRSLFIKYSAKSPVMIFFWTGKMQT